MDSSQRSEVSNAERTNLTPVKSGVKQTKGKPALSPIEEETDTPDSSGDSVVNYHDIEIVSTTKKYPYDPEVGLRNDCEQVPGDPAEEEKPRGERRDESQPFLTARNTSDHDGKYCDSSATTSIERNSEDDEEEPELAEDSSLADESTSGDVDYYCDDDYEVNESFDAANDNYDLDTVAERTKDGKDSPESSRNIKRSNDRSKFAASCSQLDSSDTSRDDKLCEIAKTLDRLKSRIVKSERDICDLNKQLAVEKIRGRKLIGRYEDDRNITRESLRIDLELWIKKLNDGLKAYLADWQKRERLRINDEISRISNVYSQEITKSLKTIMKEWQTEDTKNLYRIMEKHEKSRENIERTNAKHVYENIQMHLENLEKRNRKSYAALCKQIDKWEDRLRDEIVKLHEEDLKKLRRQVNSWYEEDCKRNGETSVNCQSSGKERCNDEKRKNSFFGAESLPRVEENLLKRLRVSSSKDLRRTEQIVRAELKIQRRELAKRMNDKISELWMAFEDFGYSPNFLDREKSRRRNDHENQSEQVPSKLNVSSGDEKIGEKITNSNRSGESSVSNSDVEKNREFSQDAWQNMEAVEERNKNNNIFKASNDFPTLPEFNTLKSKHSSAGPSTDRGEKSLNEHPK